jgi:hypothetical protein
MNADTMITATIRDTEYTLRADWHDPDCAIDIDNGYECEPIGNVVRDFASPIEALIATIHASYDDWTADDLSTAAILRSATFDGVPVLAPDVPAAVFGRRNYGASDIACNLPTSDGGDLPGWWLHMVEMADCGEPSSVHLVDIYRAAVARIIGADRAADVVGAVATA